ncbi:MAG: ketoacyl-ACP synthase III [Planctomycetes bacterium]|nr:ketoacyl-ACP synthase III [Planctomycetota bacterium]
MTWLGSIGQAIAGGVTDALDVAARLGVDPTFVRDKLGTRSLPRLQQGFGTADLAVEAVRDALSRWAGDTGQLRVLVVCTQSPDGEGLPHTAAIVQQRVGLARNLAAFDISLGCSGYVYGLAVVEGMLHSTGGYGLLVTADPYSRMINPDDRDTALLFGDAATATILGPEGTWCLGARRFATDGSGAAALERRGGRFHMAGRQVFNFAATRVPEQLSELLCSEALEPRDIDQWILHQGSRYIVETIANRMGLPLDRVPVALERTGNTVSSSIPLILRHCGDRPDLRRIVLSGFGVGLSWASMILTREANDGSTKGGQASNLIGVGGKHVPQRGARE